MTKTIKRDEPVNKKEPVATKPLRDAKGHFLPSGGTSKSSSKRPPKKAILRSVKSDTVRATPTVPGKPGAKGYILASRSKQNPSESNVTFEILPLSYNTTKNPVTGKTQTVGTIHPIKPAKPDWGATARVKLWRYNHHSVDMFKISMEPPSTDSNHCESLVTFYDISRDILALKRAINQYEKELPIETRV